MGIGGSFISRENFLGLMGNIIPSARIRIISADNCITTPFTSSLFSVNVFHTRRKPLPTDRFDFFNEQEPET